MRLPVLPPISPMLARLVREVPEGDNFVYEPKWDGFRCIVFRDGDEVVMGSRNERPLTRYFPEVEEALKDDLPSRCVLDGELVIAGPHGLDFDALLQRIHPAASRVARLASETPARLVAFDLLALDHEDLRILPLAERRRQLVEVLGSASGMHLTPQTDDVATAREWFARFEGAGLDGVVVKDASSPYLEGERAMLKVKHERNADCVVGGFRPHAQSGVGSLLLGLYDGQGILHHVGVCSGFSAARRAELADELGPLVLAEGAPHPWRAGAPLQGRRPGGPSRWNVGRDLGFEPVAPERVVEVAYDHLQGSRFRHATSFRRWRPERDPRSCTYDQLAVAAPFELSQVLGSA